MTLQLDPTQIEANKRTAVRHTEPMERGNVDLLDEILAADWVNHPTDFHEGSGVDGFKRKAKNLYDNFEFHFDHQDVTAVDDLVFIRSLVTGKVRSKIMGPQLVGAPVEFVTMECHRLRDGQIVESWHVQDYYAMLVQLGAIPNLLQRDLDPYQGWR